MTGTPATFEVQLTKAAEQELEAIHAYICEFDGVAKANQMLDGLMHVVDGLSRFEQRGNYPKELVGLGINECRQSFFEAYRLIYRATGKQITMHLIAVGHRTMQSMLARRLLAA